MFLLSSVSQSLVSFQTQSLHKNISSFSPYIPVGLLPYLAFVLLTATFGLAFYFSTSALLQLLRAKSAAYSCFVDRLPKATIPLREVAVASTASILGGFGFVALFCSVGVYV